MKSLTITLFAFLATMSLAFSQTIYIPTVVHVVYNGASQDMTNADIQKMIDSANVGFRGASTNNVISRQIFDTIWANTEIQLCLATKDENGNATNGIVHNTIPFNVMPSDFDIVKQYSTAWNVDKYMNVWICSQGTGSEAMGAFTSSPLFPGSLPYGIVINKDYAFGHELSRNHLLIHESGHYFGLLHTFEPGHNNDDDIADTPCCEDNGGLGATTCNLDLLLLNTCSNESSYWNGIDPPDMIENYMSYNLPCQKMFTKGQKVRMRTYITANLSTLISSSSTNCTIISATKDPLSANDFTVSPNPFSDYFTLETGTQNFGLKTVEIYNSIGCKIKSITTDKWQIEIRSSLWPSGVYFIRVSSNNGVVTRKIVKK